MWLLVAILAAGAWGLVVAGWVWSGLCAGVAGLLVTLLARRRTRRTSLLASLGLFAALTLVEAWQLWRLRGDTEAIDPLVVMGGLAAVTGLLVGGVTARILTARPPTGQPG